MSGGGRWLLHLETCRHCCLLMRRCLNLKHFVPIVAAAVVDSVVVVLGAVGKVGGWRICGGFLDVLDSGTVLGLC